MNILVLAATLEEIKTSLPLLEEKQIPYLITGVGMTSTVYTLTKYLQQQHVDVLLQVGIGGILDHSAQLGEVYRITTDEIFGFGADDNGSFISIEDLGFGKRIFKEKQPEQLPVPKIQTCSGITVNTTHGSHDRIQWLTQHYQTPLMESMEGAAAFFVAEQENICCLQFRAVSNYIEPRKRASWEIALAINNLNNFLQEFFRF